MKTNLTTLWLTFVLVIGSLIATTSPISAADASGTREPCLTMRLQEQFGKYIRDPDVPLRELPCDHTPAGPPANVQIGSQWDWYIWRLNGYPQADLRSCTVRGSSEHAWLVVEDTQWNLNINQADVDIILNYFENESIGQFPDQGIWDLNTSHFGMPPDHLDQDGKIYLVYYDFDVNADGYFWSFDQGCNGDGAFASNECDALYLNCSDNSPSGDYMVAVLAHEFEHLIHYEQDVNEAAWVDEGCAELAMWLFGSPDTISMFNTNPDNNLTVWNGNWADYIKTYLWMLYFYEQFGGQASVQALVSEPGNSITGFNNFFADNGYSATFADYFSNWTIANFLDLPDLATGQFGYIGDTLPPFSTSAQHTDYPVNQSGTVNHWAADYIRFTGSAPLQIDFQGIDTTEFAVWVLEVKTGYWPRVRQMELDASQTGSFVIDDFGETFSEAILVVAGVSSSGGTSYSYSATEYDPATPTPAPTPTPPWHGDDPAMRLVLNDAVFGGGDAFLLEAEFWNPNLAPLHVDTFIALSVAGHYWFWPGWIHISEGVDYQDMTLPADAISDETILSFTWPDGTGTASNLCFLGVILDHQTGVWYGETISQACFDYE